MVPKTLPQFKNILYCTDLSSNARHALSYALTVAEKFNARITVFHVVEDISTFQDSLVINIIGLEKWEQMLKENKSQALEKIEARVRNYCQEVGTALPDCKSLIDNSLVRTGNPIEEILREINTGAYDLVVLGAHGHGVLQGGVIGSVSRRIVRMSRTPVMVIRLPDDTK